MWRQSYHSKIQLSFVPRFPGDVGSVKGPGGESDPTDSKQRASGAGLACGGWTGVESWGSAPWREFQPALAFDLATREVFALQ